MCQPEDCNCDGFHTGACNERKKLATMTEQEMRETEVPRFDSLEEVAQYIKCLVDRKHDYDTCVYAMSMAAVAAFNYVARQLGVTGFQASCADMDILSRTRRIKVFSIINGEDALYPQYDLHAKLDKFLEDIKPWLKEQAIEKLAKEKDFAHNAVIAHWEKLASLEIDNEDEKDDGT